jgi:hypothetical protein
MKYSDLLQINFDWWDKTGNIQKLKKEFSINAPDSVIEQFYLDHSNKVEFIELYGDFDITKIIWKLKDFPTAFFEKIGNNATFPDFLNEKAQDASHYSKHGDWMIDGRENVVCQWKKIGTWLTPPILIDRNLLGEELGTPHLVEGHSRVGCLLGINKYKIIPLSSHHKAYWGTLKQD